MTIDACNMHDKQGGEAYNENDETVVLLGREKVRDDFRRRLLVPHVWRQAHQRDTALDPGNQLGGHKGCIHIIEWILRRRKPMVKTIQTTKKKKHANSNWRPHWQ